MNQINTENELAEQKRQFEAQLAEERRQFNTSLAKKSSGSGGGATINKTGTSAVESAAINALSGAASTAIKWGFGKYKKE